MSQTTPLLEAPPAPDWYELDDAVDDELVDSADLTAAWLRPDPVEQWVIEGDGLGPVDLSRGIGELLPRIPSDLGGIEHEITWLPGGEFLAADPGTDMFGTGATVLEAKNDLYDVLVSYRESLIDNREELGELLLSHLRHLDGILIS